MCKKSLAIKISHVIIKLVARYANNKKGGERMVNINKLRGKIIENGLSVKDLADKLEIDRSTLYRKMNSEGDTMTISDAEKISKILNLSLEEVNSIFFSDFVA